MNYGMNMMAGKKSGGKGGKGNKSAPRCGAAKGQGAGMGGYNSSSVNKAMGSVVGAAKPTYFAGAGAGRNMK